MEKFNRELFLCILQNNIDLYKNSLDGLPECELRVRWEAKIEAFESAIRMIKTATLVEESA